MALRRLYSTTAATHGWLFVDSVFPIQLGRWDVRHYIGLLQQPALLSDLKDRLDKVQVHGFRVLSVEPQSKDGGVFVKFSYTPSAEVTPDSLEQDLRDQIREVGSLPSWIGLNRGNVWLVKGTPWREDLSRFPSPVVKVSFEGPDIHEQKLYQLLRPYGRIRDLTAPTPVPAGTPRFSTLTFSRLHSASLARNILHGLPVGDTVIRLNYEQPIQAHAVKDWMGKHPKIVLPIVVFLLGSLTYTIFDPVRSFMVQSKLEDWLNLQKLGIYKWLRTNALDHIPFGTEVAASLSSKTDEDDGIVEDGWKERVEAESAIKAYLTDIPTTVAFVHGPAGSGKTTLVNHILGDPSSGCNGRTTLVLDCRQLLKATSDSQIVGDLAQQTGYWPVFTFLNSMNSLVDLASVGLIGQKTGLSSSLPDQIQQVLAVVGDALRRVYLTHRQNAHKHVMKESQMKKELEQQEIIRQRIKEGTWHDGRLDCVAGNGIMSELGIGDEVWGANDAILDLDRPHDEKDAEKQEAAKLKVEEYARKKKTEAEEQAVGALPIVIIRNFDSKSIGGGMGLAANADSREKVLDVLANWAGSLVENQVAHVIVISDNRENSKKLAQALALKPLNSIALYDADPASSLAFVKQKLKDAGVAVSFTEDEVKYLQRLGGRAADLESLIHKVRNGHTVQGAVDDIIMRAVGELRKSAFGDDMDDAEGRPWTREQVWKVIKVLSAKSEASYFDILLDFPFKGDDNALRAMETAELIAIGTYEGRPSIIRPGKPVFRWVFERLVNDRVFKATQEIAFNEKQIKAAEADIQKYENELRVLKEVEDMDGGWWRWLRGGRRAIGERGRVLVRKLGEANRKVEEWERANKELKAVVKRG